MGERSEFQPVSIGIEFLEVTVEPVSITNRSQIRQVGFCSLNFAFYSDSCMVDWIAESMCASTWRTGLTSV